MVFSSRLLVSLSDCQAPTAVSLPPGHRKISLDSSQQTVESGNGDSPSDILGFPFQATLGGLWGLVLFILGDFLERQKWLRNDHRAVCCLSDIQSPHTALNFNEFV